MIPDIDPERVRIGLAAFAGAVVYGVFTLVTLFMTGAHVSRADFLRAALNVLAAALCGVVTAMIVAPAIAAMIPWEAARDLPTISFVIGAAFWELLPFIFKAMKNRAAREATKQGAGE
tara:strand:- start:893 stop:1246 length:354 start_codon:yes stop_codon:yes gene_type:complete